MLVAVVALAAWPAAAQFVPYPYGWAPRYYRPPPYAYVRPYPFVGYPPPPPVIVVPPPYVVAPYAPGYAVPPPVYAVPPPVWRPRVVFRPAPVYHQPRRVHRPARVAHARPAAVRRRPVNPLFGPLPGR